MLAPAAVFEPRTMHTQPNLTPALPTSILEVGGAGVFYVRHVRVGSEWVGLLRAGDEVGWHVGWWRAATS